MRYNAIALTAVVLSLIVAAPFSSIVVARDIYVNNSLGRDEMDGRSATVELSGTGPVQTIRRALHLAEKGDRIILAKTDEPYREMISLSSARHSGFRRQPFEIVGSGAVLDGTRPVPPDQWRQVRGDVYRVSISLPRYQIIFIDGKPTQRQAAPPDDNGVPELGPLQWNIVGNYIYFCTEQGKYPDKYEVRYASLQTGITLYQVEYVQVSNLVVQGFRLDGVNAHDTVRHAELDSMNCRACGRSGVSVGGASRLVLRDCYLYDNGQAQLRTTGFSIVRLFSTELDATSAPALAQDGGQVFIDGEPYIPSDPVNGPH